MSATELNSLSKLKTAGKLHFWRGTIEIPECELHSICDEIQAEHERAIDAAMGRGECKIVSYTTDGLMSSDPKRFFHLSCGHWVGLPGLRDAPKFCPECGSRVNECGLKVKR